MRETTAAGDAGDALDAALALNVGGRRWSDLTIGAARKLTDKPGAYLPESLGGWAAMLDAIEARIRALPPDLGRHARAGHHAHG
jgi:hypothetical protein